MNLEGPTIPFARPEVGEDEAAAVREVLLSGWITQGPQVAAFEQEFAAYVGAPHACAASSCTAALHLALYALGVGPGDEVVTVSHTFIATANAVRYCGARPVFADIAPDTLNMDPGLVERAITSRTRAILAVHQIGLPCDMPSILPIAARHRLPVVEDAACAVGSELLSNGVWERIGRPHGVVACFSFHPRKLLTTGEGGMLTTADPELDLRFRRLRQHAMTIPDTVRHSSREVLVEAFPEVGFNYKMSDLQAAVGRTQLKRLPGLIDKRVRQAGIYSFGLRAIQGLGAPKVPPYARTNFQSYAVRVTAEYPISRDRLMQYLLDRGISTRRGIMNVHQEPAYAGLGPYDLPHSECARDSVILLPLRPDMTDGEIHRVLGALANPV